MLMKLTAKQAAYALAVAQGANSTAAARLAGYADNSDTSLRTQASRLANDPNIQRAIFEHRERRLSGPLATKALACLEGVLDDPTAPPQAKIQAAKFVLEAAGHGIESRRLATRQPDNEGRLLSDYTIAELQDVIDRGETDLKRTRGRVLESEPGEGDED